MAQRWTKFRFSRLSSRSSYNWIDILSAVLRNIYFSRLLCIPVAVFGLSPGPYLGRMGPKAGHNLMQVNQLSFSRPQNLRSLLINLQETRTGSLDKNVVGEYELRCSRCGKMEQKSCQQTSSHRASVKLIEPESGCEVTLLGCFHGSQSSAADVRDLLMYNNDNEYGNFDAVDEGIRSTVDVVVLELCASRFTDLRREHLRKNGNEHMLIQQDESNIFSGVLSNVNRDNESAPTLTRPGRSWWQRYGYMVQTVFQRKGVSTAIAAAVLGGVSGMQTALSGLEPGLEFITALDIVLQKSDQDSNHDMDIVLADQNVDETLSRIGKLPSISLKLWMDFFSNGWKESFGRESDALLVALFGDNNLAGDHRHQQCQVSLLSFLTRSGDALKDLARLTIPPFCLLQILNFLVLYIIDESSFTSTIASTNNAMLIDGLATISSSTTAMPTWAVVVSSALSIGLGYLSVVLPATQVILRERDDQLARGIQAACQIVVEKNEGKADVQSTSHLDAAVTLPQSRGRVVAVLGLLHVNGVTQRLLTKQT